MSVDSGAAAVRGTKPDWYHSLSDYSHPDPQKAVWQIINTLVPYLALWIILIVLFQRGYPFWLLLPLILAGSAFLVRIFILFHDCTHNSFFASSRANTILGYITGILTFTPYDDWRRTHGIHHNIVGNLDRRGVGEIDTMTVDEYRGASTFTRIKYRVYRNPVILFLLGPGVLFLLIQRFPSEVASKRERESVLFTNLAILVIIFVMSATIGLGTYLLIQGPIILVAASIGVWFFYIQHQFEGVYWARQKNWDQMRASVEGSSYYKLPGLLRWFSGDIGLHHLHHIRPRMPNYHLKPCFDDITALQSLREPLTVRRSLRSLSLNIYDETSGKLMSFREMKRLPLNTE